MRVTLTKTAFLALVSKHAVAVHDWLTDPPMTERDRIKRYIAETRAAANKRYLLRRF